MDNFHEFQGSARERNLAYAQGWNPSARAARGGISFPQEIKLRRGSILYRVGHSHRQDGSKIADWENLCSPWWMTDSTFLEIAGRSEDAGTEIGLLVRMKLALTPDFGCCDMLFRVQLKNTLRAWNGRGFPVFENGTAEERERNNLPMAWYGGYEIAQNFVPGLRDFANNRPTQCALDSLAPLPPLPLSSYAKVRDGGQAFVPFPWPVP